MTFDLLDSDFRLMGRTFLGLDMSMNWHQDGCDTHDGPCGYLDTSVVVGPLTVRLCLTWPFQVNAEVVGQLPDAHPGLVLHLGPFRFALVWRHECWVSGKCHLKDGVDDVRDYAGDNLLIVTIADRRVLVVIPDDPSGDVRGVVRCLECSTCRWLIRSVAIAKDEAANADADETRKWAELHECRDDDSKDDENDQQTSPTSTEESS